MHRPLASPFGKVRRAGEQIKNLEQEIKDFLDSQALTAGVEPYAFRELQRQLSVHQFRQLGIPINAIEGAVLNHDGSIQLKCRVIEKFRIRLYTTQQPRTIEWSVMVGEIVHNLRSALDHVVWELSILHQSRLGNPVPADRIRRRDPWGLVTFPVTHNAGPNESAWKGAVGSKLKFVSPSVVEQIKKLQPFRTHRVHPDQHPLAILDDLWQRDKHREIPLVSSLVRLDSIGPGGPIYREEGAPSVGRTLVYRRRYGPVDHGVLLARVHLHPTSLLNHDALDEYVRDNLYFAFDITFDKGPSYYNGRRVIETLERLFSTVSAILTRFQQTEFS